MAPLAVAVALHAQVPGGRSRGTVRAVPAAVNITLGWPAAVQMKSKLVMSDGGRTEPSTNVVGAVHENVFTSAYAAPLASVATIAAKISPFLTLASCPHSGSTCCLVRLTLLHALLLADLFRSRTAWLRLLHLLRITRLRAWLRSGLLRAGECLLLLHRGLLTHLVLERLGIRHDLLVFQAEVR